METKIKDNHNKEKKVVLLFIFIAPILLLIGLTAYLNQENAFLIAFLSGYLGYIVWLAIYIVVFFLVKRILKYFGFNLK